MKSQNGQGLAELDSEDLLETEILRALERWALAQPAVTWEPY